MWRKRSVIIFLVLVAISVSVLSVSIVEVPRLLSDPKHLFSSRAITASNPSSRYLERRSGNISTGKNTTPCEFHQWMYALPRIHSRESQGSLWSLVSFVITQDLSSCSFTLWISAFNQTQNEFYLPPSMKLFIRIRHWLYEEEIRGSPLEHDAFYGVSEAVLISRLGKKLGVVSDVVRYLLLSKYGGCWIDNDAVLLRSFEPLLNKNIEFAPKFFSSHFNTHIMCMNKLSRLSQRALESMILFPYNNQSAWPMQPMTKLKHWYINDAMTKFVWMNNNYNSQDDTLTAVHMEYFDPYWSFHDLESQREDPILLSQSQRLIFMRTNVLIPSYALHTRYPKLSNFSRNSVLDMISSRVEPVISKDGRCFATRLDECFGIQSHDLFSEDDILRYINTAPNESKVPKEIVSCVFHQWAYELPTISDPKYEVFLYSAAAFLKTQDLQYCRLILWVSKINQTAAERFYPATFRPFVEIRGWNYTKDVLSTIAEHRNVFRGTELDLARELGRFSNNRLSQFSEIVPFWIVAKHGGLWLDPTTLLVRSIEDMIHGREALFLKDSKGNLASSFFYIRNESVVRRDILRALIMNPCKQWKSWRPFRLWSDARRSFLTKLACEASDGNITFVSSSMFNPYGKYKEQGYASLNTSSKSLHLSLRFVALALGPYGSAYAINLGRSHVTNPANDSLLYLVHSALQDIINSSSSTPIRVASLLTARDIVQHVKGNVNSTEIRVSWWDASEANGYVERTI